MDAAFFNNLVSSIDFTMMVRLIVSAIFGGIVGMERGSGDRPAGFRTHILVCAGSTLIMLVSALYGYEKTMAAYKVAVEEKYRFFSFGDSMMIL